MMDIQFVMLKTLAQLKEPKGLPLDGTQSVASAGGREQMVSLSVFSII